MASAGGGGGRSSSKAKMKEEEEEDLGLAGAALTVGAAALAMWGIAKWFGSSEKEPEKMMKAPGQGGRYMPRKDFEQNPSDYFRNQRAKK
ncbi:hypothetical protein ABFX02_05G024300 [Erythranthe guttata]